MDMLQIKDGKIVDQSGAPISLKGSCVGGWMNMENFINGYPGSESGIRSAVAEVLGASKGDFFFDRMLDYLLSEDDIRFMAECGATVVRLPLNYRHFEDDSKPFVYKEEGFRKLDRVLEWCAKYKLYAILDLHSVQGWQNPDWHCDNDSNHTYFWNHPHFIDRYVSLWEALADHYKDNQTVAGYDVMNEPVCNSWRGKFTSPERYQPDWAKINSVFHRVVKAVRAIDPRHIIFLEGDYFASRFSGFEEPFDSNLAYSSHNYTHTGFGPGCYPGIQDNQMKNLESQEKEFLNHEGTQFTEKHHVPLWVGEFGSVYNGPAVEIPDRLRALDDQLTVFERYGAHWTTWTYKDVGVMSWVQLDPKSDYMQIVQRELEAKRLLDTDQWMGWLPDTAAKSIIRSLSRYVAETVGDDSIEQDALYSNLKQSALCGYTATLMQPSYAALFRGMSEDRIDEVMQSFALKNCVVNHGLVELLKKHMKIN